MISVLIAVRNEENTIERCLESLNNQDYPDDRIEILIGNDMSEDSTLEILKEYEKKATNIRVLNISKLLKKSPER